MTLTNNPAAVLRSFCDELRALKPVNEGAPAASADIFWEGVQVKWAKRDYSVLPNLALTAVAALGGLAALSEAFSGIAAGQPYGWAMFAGAVYLPLAARPYAEKFTLEVMAEGYYSRVCDIVDRHLGSLLGEPEKEELKQNITQWLGEDRLDKIEEFAKTRIEKGGKWVLEKKLEELRRLFRDGINGKP